MNRSRGTSAWATLACLAVACAPATGAGGTTGAAAAGASSSAGASGGSGASPTGGSTGSGHGSGGGSASSTGTAGHGSTGAGTTGGSGTRGGSTGTSGGSVRGSSGGGNTGGGSSGASASGGGSTGASCAPAAPSYVAAAGYHTNVFSTDCDGWDVSPDGSGGHDWYLTQFFGSPTTPGSCVSVDGGVLTIDADQSGCGGNANGNLATAGPASNAQGYVGNAWGGGAYFEAQLAFDPTLTSSGWPSFWAMAIEHLAGRGADQWPGQASGYAHFIETDFFEFDTTWAPDQYGGAMHDWFGQYTSGGYTNDSNDGSGSNFDDFVIGVPSSTDFTQFHRYGFLWIPSVGGNPGSAQYYFDGTATTDLVTWNGPPPATPPPSGSDVFSILDQDHLAVLLGTGPGWPMQVRSVDVWQAP